MAGKLFRKTGVLVLALAFVLGLISGCGSTAAGTAESAADTASDSESIVESTTEETEPEAEPSEETAPDAEAPDAEDEPAPEPESEEAPEEEESPSYTITYPLTEETVTLTLMHSEPALGPLSGNCGIDSYADIAGIQAGGEATGINIEWRELAMQTASESFNLVIASGDYPDMISSVDNYYAGGLAKAFEDEVIMDVGDIVAEYAPDYYAAIQSDSELYRQTLDDEGHTLGIYAIYNEAISNDGSMIRKDWLDQLGLEIPTTIDELTDVMTAIQSELGVANPIYMNESCNFLAYSFDVQGFDLSNATIPIYHDGDTVYCSLTSDGYKAYIEQLHDWYLSGIINPNFMEFSSDLMSGETEVEINADRVAMWDGMVTNMTNYYASAADPDFEVVPTVIAPDGIDHITEATRSQDAISLSMTCASPELALGWINYWFTDEGIMIYNYGLEGDTYTMDSAGNISYTDKVMNNDLGVDPTLFCRTFSLAGCAFGYTVQERVYLLYEDYQTEAQEYWTEHTDGSMAVPTLSLTTEESDVIATYGTDITTYAAENIPKFVIGDLDLSEWDNYVATLEDMNIEGIVEVYQNAYTRYLSR